MVLKKDLTVMGNVLGPNGSRLYKKAGSVGVVAEQPLTNEYPYMIAFADDHIVKAVRTELTIRRADAPEDDLAAREIGAYSHYVIYSVRMGSHAFGLSNENSDTDERGVYLPPAEWHWSMQPLPEQVEFKKTAGGEILDHNSAVHADDTCWWEIEKFVRLALKANPNVLEALYAPERDILRITPMGQNLRGIRDVFISRYVYQTYSGYVLSQFKKLKRDIENGGTPRHKHSMHLIRLLYSGIEALRGHGVMVDVGQYREELLTIKRGERSFDDVYRQALALNQQFEMEFNRTTLAERPDVAAADRFLIEARRSMTA